MIEQAAWRKGRRKNKTTHTHTQKKKKKNDGDTAQGQEDDVERRKEKRKGPKGGTTISYVVRIRFSFRRGGFPSLGVHSVAVNGDWGVFQEIFFSRCCSFCCVCVCDHFVTVDILRTAFVPSETAWVANSPGRRSLTADCISRAVMVMDFLYMDSVDASRQIRSKISCAKEFITASALSEILKSGCTCFKTRYT